MQSIHTLTLRPRLRPTGTMRKLTHLAAALLLGTSLHAQAARPAARPSPAKAALSPQVATDIYSNLVGSWTGELEYRDFNPDPRHPDARTTLPTTLEVSLGDDGHSLTLRYTFQDGPNKVIHDTTHVVIDPATRTWTTTADNDPTDVYQIEGLETLKAGRGKLKLRNQGTESQGKGPRQKIDTLTNITLGKDLFVMERLTRLAGSRDEFKFRHVYNFARATTAPPAATGAMPAAPTPDANLPAAPEPAQH